MAAFPHIGRLLVDGFSGQRDPKLLRTEMERGPIVQTQQQSHSQHIRPLTYLFTQAEYQQFEQWWDNDIKRGVLNFQWLDPVSNQHLQGRMVGGRYSWQPHRRTLKHLLVQFELEVFD